LIVILDTGEIIQRYAQYDPLFSFYEDGVREVVKMAALEAGRRKPYFLEDRESEVYWMRSLAGRITMEWEYALDQKLEQQLDWDETHQHDRQRLTHMFDERSLVQLVVEQIEEDVDRTIHGLTGERVFRVRPHFVPQVNKPNVVIPFERKQSEWLGDSLVVRINPASEE
jgi:hypothetical protein